MLNQWGPALLVVLSILLAALYNNKRIDDLRSDMNARFAALQKYLDARFQALDDRLDRVEERVTKIEERIERPVIPGR